MAEQVLRGDTRLTWRWGRGDVHDHLSGMSGRAIVAYYGAAQDIQCRSGGLRLTLRTRSDSITPIPEGHEGRWDIVGSIGVSHVYLTNQRLQSCADLLAHGQSVELIDRVGFEDPSASRIMQLLSMEAERNDSASGLFVEQAIDLLCVQLLRGHSSFGRLPEFVPRGRLADWQVKRVTTCMRDHLDQDITWRRSPRWWG